MLLVLAGLSQPRLFICEIHVVQTVEATAAAIAMCIIRLSDGVSSSVEFR